MSFQVWEDSSGGALRFPKLNDLNYRSWKYDLSMSLRDRGLFGFIDNSEVPPSTDQETKHPGSKERFNLRKSKALATIALSVEDDLKQVIRNCTTAQEAWSTLNGIFEPKSRARIGHLRKEFVLMKMEEGETMAKYISRVRNAVADLKDAGKDVPDNEQAYQLLCGLSSQWDSVVERLYSLPDDEFKTLTIRERLIMEFERRNPTSQIPTVGSSTKSFSTNLPIQKGNDYSVRSVSRSKNSQKMNYPRTPSFQAKRNITCFNCGKYGHIARNCRQQRNGFSSCNTGAFYVEANIISVEMMEWTYDTAATDHFCPHREWFSNYKEVSVQYAEVAEGTSKVCGMGDIYVLIQQNGVSSKLCLRNVLHAPGMRRNLLSGIKVYRAGYGLMSDDQGLVVSTLEGKIFFHAFAKGNFFVFNAKLDGSIGPIASTVGFVKDDQSVPNLKVTDFPILPTIESLSDSSEPIVHNNLYSKVDVKQARVGTPIKQKPDTLSNTMLWHERLGHINLQSLKNAVNHKKIAGIRHLSQNESICIPCHLGKSTRAKHVTIEECRSKAPLDLIHSDVWGPSPVTSPGGARYFISFIDDFTRKCTIYLMKTKDEALKYFREYKVKVERQTGLRIKCLRTDNGLEYCSKEFQKELDQLGIKAERTNIYSPQMNGIAERLNRTLLDSVRTLLNASGLSAEWWAELVLTASYLKNKCPHSGIHGNVPDAIWYKRTPAVHHLKRIGCLCFVHEDRPRKTKFQSRAKLGILVGYAFRTQGYRVWIPEDGRHMVRQTKSVRFDEMRMGMEALRTAKSYGFVEFQLENIEEELLPPNQIDPLPTVVTKAPPIIHPPVCPEWERQEISRKTGRSKGRIDVYYYHQGGPRLRSEKEVRQYCRQEGLLYNPKDFNFKSTVPGSVEIIDSQTQDTTPSTSSVQTSSQSLVDSHEEENYSFTDYDVPHDYEAHCVEILIPKTFQEAIQSQQADKWQEAMREEISILKKRRVYTKVKSQESTKIIGSRWVYTTKTDTSGKIARYRARLVAQGYAQKEGLDYFETFSPVISFTLVRVFFFLLVTCLEWVHTHLDINCAYLYGTLREMTYIRPAPGFEGSPGEIWNLHKALYGLHQSGRAWFTELDATFSALDFQKLLSTNCIYTYHRKALVLVYVDDLAVFAINREILEEVIGLLKRKYEIKDLGEIQKFLGIEITKGEQGTYTFHQRSYIEKLAIEFNIDTTQGVSVPLDVGVKVSKEDCPSEFISKNITNVPYRSLIGALMFIATRTRPDILFAVTNLSQFNSKQGWNHWILLRKVLRYLYDTRNLGLCLNKPSNTPNLIIFTDSSWASCIDDRKSWSGYVGFLAGCPITWRVQKQKCVALSTMESEFIGLSSAVTEVQWISAILKELDFIVIDLPPKIYCDNLAAIAFAKNNTERMATKHIDIKYMYVRDALLRGEFQLNFVSTSENIADIFTKPLTKQPFIRLRNALVN